MSYVLLFLPRCLALKKCIDFKKSSSSLHSTSQYDTNMPVTEIEEQIGSNQELNQIHTNQTNHQRRINFADDGSPASPSIRAESGDYKIRFNTSATSSPVSTSRLTPKLNFSSSADHRIGSPLASIVKSSETIDSLADKQINLRFKDEDLNNNAAVKSASLNQTDGDGDENRPKIEMKTFRKVASGTSYESEYSPDSAAAQLQTHKNGNKITLNRHLTKNLQRSVSEKSNQDNTAKQVITEQSSSSSTH